MATKRRPQGTGSIYERHGIWYVAIYAGPKRIRRRRYTREAAEAALAEILEMHADQLGVFYRGERHFLPRGLPRPPRSGVTKRVRWMVFERDGFRCVYCGANAEQARLVVDHVQPIADGGTDDIDNLATACDDCNAGKGGRPLVPRERVA